MTADTCGTEHAKIGVTPAIREILELGSMTTSKEQFMIRHVVLFRRRDDVAESEITAVLDELMALQASVPGIVAMSCGTDNSPEGLQRGMTHGFNVDFVDADARDGYLVHPQHQAAGARLVAVTEGGLDGLLVLDWMM